MFYEKPKRPATTQIKCVVCGEKMKDFEVVLNGKRCSKCVKKKP